MKSFLLDTHIFIWYAEGNPRLSGEVIEKISNPLNTIYLSKVSLWEIVIKSSLKKLSISIPLSELINLSEQNTFQILDFDADDLMQLHSLPFYHGDPFDRLLIAQAMTNQVTIISNDSKFSQYPVSLLAA